MKRRVLVVFAHPSSSGYSGAIRDLVVKVCRERGSDVRVHDLYETGFSPVMSPNEWVLRMGSPDTKAHLRTYFDDVQWCDTLAFVYPTWWSGQPAIMKAWIDRVLANGVAWNLDKDSGHALPALRNVTRIIAITTHGRSRWANLWCGRSGRIVLTRCVRRLCSWRCRVNWLALYSLDGSTRYERDRFMQRVERVLRRVV